MTGPLAVLQDTRAVICLANGTASDRHYAEAGFVRAIAC
jgi:hypothetical protein